MDDDLTGGDELDAALRRTLATGRGPGSSTERAWSDLAPRLQRARRRHRAAVVAGSLVVILGVSAAVLATGPMEQRGEVIVPAGRPHRSTTTRPPPATGSTLPTGSTTSTVAVAPSVPAGAGGGPAPGTGSGATDTTTTTTAAAVAPAPPDETRTYTAPGGRATVRVAGGALTLLAQVANPGYTAEVTKTDPDDVEVRFHPDGGRDSRIRVRIQAGAVTSETE